MSDWQQKIEAQIEALHDYAGPYSTDTEGWKLLHDAADSLQALLDVAVAAELWVAADDIRDSFDLAAQLEDALDKLREVL